MLTFFIFRFSYVSCREVLDMVLFILNLRIVVIFYDIIKIGINSNLFLWF